MRILERSHQGNSVRTIPRFTPSTGPEIDESNEDLSVLALEQVTRWHTKKLEVGNLYATYGAQNLTDLTAPSREHFIPLPLKSARCSVLSCRNMDDMSCHMYYITCLLEIYSSVIYGCIECHSRPRSS